MIEIVLLAVFIVLVLMGFIIYYIWTGETPIDFWNQIEGTAGGTTLNVIIGAVIIVLMLTIALWFIKRSFR